MHSDGSDVILFYTPFRSQSAPALHIMLVTVCLANSYIAYALLEAVQDISSPVPAAKPQFS